MTSSLEVRIASPDERLPLFRMLELYQHDLSDIWDQDLDVHGESSVAPRPSPYSSRIADDGKSVK